MSSELEKILQTIPHVGTLEWIGLRPDRRAEIQVVSAVQVSEENGLVGDRFNGKPGSDRQVTLVQFEHLAVVAKIMGETEVDPALLRRNLVVSGINLLSLKNRYFAIGNVVLYGTGNCQPCSRMEENLGPGGYNAMRGHGGITARVETGGEVRKGDEVRAILDPGKSNIR